MAASILSLTSCKTVEPAANALKINNGEQVSSDSLVAKSTVLLRGDGQNTCTGTIIGKRTILTAAHCIMDDFYQSAAFDKLDVVFGYRFLENPIVISGDTVAHPDVNGFQGGRKFIQNDIGIVKLSRNIPAGFEPVEISTANQGDEVILAGYGVTAEQEQAYMKILNRRNQLKYESTLRLINILGNNELKPELENWRAAESAMVDIADIRAKAARFLALTKGVPTDGSQEFPEPAKALYKEISDATLVVASWIMTKKLDKVIVDKAKESQDIINDPAASREFNRLQKTTTTVEQFYDQGNVIVYASANGENSACSGDSGGPMYVKRKGKLAVVGATSGPDMSRISSVEDFCRGIGLYTHVASFSSWIKQNSNDNSIIFGTRGSSSASPIDTDNPGNLGSPTGSFQEEPSSN